MTITKSSKWYFVANLGYDEKGNRVRHWQRGFGTQKKAKIAYDEYMNNYSKTAIKINSTMSYKEFYETYFEPDYKRSVGQSTFDNRKSSMRLHFAFFYTTKLKDINAVMLKRWQNKLSEKYSNAYIRNVYGTFQMSLDLAVKLGLIQSNIAKQVGNVKKVYQKIDFWTLDEFQKVIATFDTTDYYERFSFIFLWLMFMTGLRIGEAQALLWDKDINFEERTLTVNKSMYYKSANEFYIKEPKTKAGNRVIALDEQTICYLSEWRKLQEKNVPTKYVLSYNGIPINKSTAKHIIERHSKLAGVHRIKTHALRHSHASLLISLGENALIVRDRLGHEDIETTLGTYGHLYPNTNREVANKLNKLIEVKQDTSIERKFISNQFVKRSQEIQEKRNCMIYLTGDIHGNLEVDRLTRFFENKSVTKEDFVIILGDAGVCWDGGKKDALLKQTLHDLPLTTLFIDGNHENFDLLNDYPVSYWNGGQVHEIEPDIIHLMRGQIFEIDGKTFFTMGGASSTDKMYRKEGIDWWPEELPSQEDYDQGVNTLEKHGNQVDYILTHTAPYEVISAMDMEVFETENGIQQYLQTLADEIEFEHWYFGHFHEDLDLDEIYHCLMDRFISLP